MTSQISRREFRKMLVPGAALLLDDCRGTSIQLPSFDIPSRFDYIFRMRNKEAGAGRHRLIYLLSVAQRRVQRWMAAQPSSEVTPAPRLSMLLDQMEQG